MADQPDPAPEESAPIPSQPGPACRYLRSKGNYVYTDEANSEDQGDYDNTIFWCQKTLKDIGPDEGFVGRDDCRVTSRSCYEAD